MSREDLIALSPLIAAAYLPVLGLLASAFWRSVTGMALLSIISLGVSLGAIAWALPLAPREVTALLRIDRFSLFFSGLSFAGGIAVAVLARDYLVRLRAQERGDRFYLLLLFAVFGMTVAACSSHFASFFLGLETLTISLYAMVGFTRRRRESLEGGIKYLILGATASAFLLFGIALLYADHGTMELARLGAAIRDAGGAASRTSLLGLGLIVAGFGFKLALVPFHMWSPDVYQGAPAPAAALISTGSKGAIFALLFRFFGLLGAGEGNALFTALFVVAVLTMFGGNLLALLQRNLKRMLAYSSVAHMGYLLIPLLAGGAGAASFGFYLVSYFATVIAAFGVIAVLSGASGEAERLDDLRGLAYRQPLPAAVLALAMLSLTGIPLTAGFVGKVFIFGAGIRANLWPLVIAGIINSGLSAFYYLRVLVALYATTEQGPELSPVRPWGGVGLATLALALIAVGVYPAPLIRLAEAALG